MQIAQLPPLQREEPSSVHEAQHLVYRETMVIFKIPKALGCSNPGTTKGLSASIHCTNLTLCRDNESVLEIGHL